MSAEARQQRATFKLTKRLEQVASNSRLDNSSLRSFLKELKRMYLSEGGACSTERGAGTTMGEVCTTEGGAWSTERGACTGAGTAASSDMESD